MKLKIKIIIVLFFGLFFASQVIQNIAPKSFRKYDFAHNYIFNPFNIAPKNWGMFTHHFYYAYERSLVFYTKDGVRLLKNVKGLNFSIRRAPWNDLMEQIIVDVNQDKSAGIKQKRLAAYYCKNGLDNKKIVAIQFLERKLPIDSLTRKEDQSVRYPFVILSDVYCEQI